MYFILVSKEFIIYNEIQRKIFIIGLNIQTNFKYNNIYIYTVYKLFKQIIKVINIE